MRDYVFGFADGAVGGISDFFLCATESRKSRERTEQLLTVNDNYSEGRFLGYYAGLATGLTVSLLSLDRLARCGDSTPIEAIAFANGLSLIYELGRLITIKVRG